LRWWVVGAARVTAVASRRRQMKEAAVDLRRKKRLSWENS
jgi:hypothetical protein